MHGSQTKKILKIFWQSINIFNIMARFGRYDHVTKNSLSLVTNVAEGT